MRFTPCPSCARHVKAGDCTCPFCGAKVACVAPGAQISRRGMSRAALFAASALGTIFGASDCASNTPPMSLYGGSFPIEADAGLTEDAGLQPGDATPPEAGDESPGAIALYGGFAPVDASDDTKDDG